MKCRHHVGYRICQGSFSTSFVSDDVTFSSGSTTTKKTSFPTLVTSRCSITELLAGSTGESSTALLQLWLAQTPELSQLLQLQERKANNTTWPYHSPLVLSWETAAVLWWPSTRKTSQLILAWVKEYRNKRKSVYYFEDLSEMFDSANISISNTGWKVSFFSVTKRKMSFCNAHS